MWESLSTAHNATAVIEGGLLALLVCDAPIAIDSGKRLMFKAISSTGLSVIVGTAIGSPESRITDVHIAIVDDDHPKKPDF